VPILGGPTRMFGPGFPGVYFGLPDGADCTVTETEQAGATSVEIDPETFTVDADAEIGGDLIAATVTNTYDAGSIAVDKVVDFDGDAYDVGPFEVTLECTFQGADIEIPDGAAREVAGGETVTYDGLPIGAECVVTETDDGGAESTTISTVDGGDPGAATVVAGDATAITVTNTFPDVPPPPAPDNGDNGGSPGWMPRTGTDVAWILGLAVLLTAAGVILVNVRRRRQL